MPDMLLQRGQSCLMLLGFGFDEGVAVCLQPLISELPEAFLHVVPDFGQQSDLVIYSYSVALNLRLKR